MLKKSYIAPKLIDPKLTKPRPLVPLPDGSLAVLLSRGRFAVIDSEDREKVEGSSWFLEGEGYAAASIDGRMVKMHRLIMQAMPGQQVDHINGNKLDNRRENLRLCTKQENGRNRGVNENNTSGFKGVSRHKQTLRFQARIMVDGRRKHLGLFDTAEEAAQAYDAAAIEHFGEFAWLNVPSEDQ